VSVDRRERKNASRGGTKKKTRVMGGSMPYAPPGAGSVLEASVERVGIYVSVREHSAFSVSLDRRECKNASRRRSKQVGTLKKTRVGGTKQGSGGDCQCRQGKCQRRTHHRLPALCCDRGAPCECGQSVWVR